MTSLKRFGRAAILAALSTHDALSPAVSNRHPDAGSNSRRRTGRPGTERGRSWDDRRCRAKQPHGLNLDSDSPGASRCNSGCPSTWPPLTIASKTTPTGGPGVTGQLGTITRADGSLQVIYKGVPLYFFHSDNKPGDTKGNDTGWSLVKA